MNKTHDNYAFMIDYAKKNAPQGRILDYGCGAGEVVKAGLEEGLDIYGCDVDFKCGQEIEVSELLGKRIRKMVYDCIPYPDSYFDCVVNNQAIEHAKNLNAMLHEVRRVLKPNGYLLSLCPSIEVIREGHCGVPLAHRFSKYRKFGYCWLLFFRLLGFGYFTKGKLPCKWAADFRLWLDENCLYRTEKEITDTFCRYKLNPVGIEKEYLKFRNLSFLTPWMFRKIGGMVLESRKHEYP